MATWKHQSAGAEAVVVRRLQRDGLATAKTWDLEVLAEDIGVLFQGLSEGWPEIAGNRWGRGAVSALFPLLGDLVAGDLAGRWALLVWYLVSLFILCHTKDS